MDKLIHSSEDGVPLTMERYWNKVGSDTGMTMFPAPTEMPSAPAISLNYIKAPQAAIIIDNLNMLESALADVVAYLICRTVKQSLIKWWHNIHRTICIWLKQWSIC